ncbi:MAG TPA: G1 family glutamic endopeptidase [Streptosporangiaceae bacterium]|nr:G1 family glutamic endopeptidase [Streptosporangiaceae bacterium]
MAGAAALSLGLASGPAASASTAQASTAQVRHVSQQARALAVARNAIKHLKIGQHGRIHRMDSHSTAVTGQNQVETNNWSGYADDNSSGSTYSEVAGSWTEPGVSCTSSSDTELAAFWVGLDGYNTDSVEQDGTLAECYDGAVYHFTWWEMYPTNAIQVVGESVNPGDSIYAYAVDEGGGTYALSVTDYSDSADSFSTVQTCSGCADASAEWIAEAPSGGGGIYPLPNYGSWSVSGATVTSGSQGVISSFPDDEITMVDGSGNPESVPSGLSGSGDGFTTYWEASS